MGSKVMCGKVTYGKVMCGEVICGRVTCGQVICGKVMCGQVMNGKVMNVSHGRVVKFFFCHLCVFECFVVGDQVDRADVEELAELDHRLSKGINPLTYGKSQSDGGRHIWEKRLFFSQKE